MTYSFNDPKPPHRRDQHLGDYFAHVAAGLPFKGTVVCSECKGSGCKACLQAGSYTRDMEMVEASWGGLVMPRHPRWNDDATNLRHLGLAGAHDAESTGETLLSLLRSQVLSGDPKYSLGLRGRSEGRSVGYAEYTHRAWLACILRPDLYDEDLGDYARELLRQDLTLYALCALPDGRVVTPCGRIYNPNGEVPEGLSYVIALLLNLTYRPDVGPQWWERRGSYTSQIWRENHKELNIFTSDEAAALRGWILARQVGDTLHKLIEPIRLATSMSIAAGAPGNHVAWYRDTRGWYLSGESKAQVVARALGPRGVVFTVRETAAGPTIKIDITGAATRIDFPAFAPPIINGENSPDTGTDLPRNEWHERLDIVRKRLDRADAQDEPQRALTDVHSYLEQYI